MGATARADWSDYRVEQRCWKLSDTLFRSDAADWAPARIAEVETYCQGSLPGLLLLAQLRLSTGDFDEARRLLAVVDGMPGAERSGRYLFWRGYLAARDGDYVRSLLAYRRAAGQGGVEAWVLDYNSADALMAQGRLDEAISSYRRAQRGRPDSRAVALGLAVALDRAGDLEGAQRVLQQTLRGERRPDRAWPRGLVLFPVEEEHVYRALLLAYLGRAKEACEELARFLEMAPQSPYAAHAAERLAALALVADRHR